MERVPQVLESVTLSARRPLEDMASLQQLIAAGEGHPRQGGPRARPLERDGAQAAGHGRGPGRGRASRRSRRTSSRRPAEIPHRSREALAGSPSARPCRTLTRRNLSPESEREGGPMVRRVALVCVAAALALPALAAAGERSARVRAASGEPLRQWSGRVERLLARRATSRSRLTRDDTMIPGRAARAARAAPPRGPGVRRRAGPAERRRVHQATTPTPSPCAAPARAGPPRPDTQADPLGVLGARSPTGFSPPRRHRLGSLGAGRRPRPRARRPAPAPGPLPARPERPLLAHPDDLLRLPDASPSTPRQTTIRTSFEAGSALRTRRGPPGEPLPRARRPGAATRTLSRDAERTGRGLPSPSPVPEPSAAAPRPRSPASASPRRRSHLDVAYARTSGHLDWALFAGATLFQVEADLLAGADLRRHVPLRRAGDRRRRRPPPSRTARPASTWAAAWTTASAARCGSARACRCSTAPRA